MMSIFDISGSDNKNSNSPSNKSESSPSRNVLKENGSDSNKFREINSSPEQCFGDNSTRKLSPKPNFSSENTQKRSLISQKSSFSNSRIIKNQSNTYLRIIKSNYYVRARLPKLGNFERNEICFSLRTKDQWLAKIGSAIFKRLLEHPAHLTCIDLKRLTLQMLDFVQHRTSNVLDNDLIGVLLSESYPDGFDGAALLRAGRPDGIIDNDLNRLKKQNAIRTQALLESENIKYEKDSSSYELLEQRLLHCEHTVNKLAIANHNNDFNAVMDISDQAAKIQHNLFATPEVIRDSYKISLPKLSELFRDFVENGRNPKSGELFSDNRKKQLRETCNELIFFLGDKPVNEYKKKHMEYFLDILVATPRSRASRFADKTVEELKELAIKHPSASLDTRKKHFQRINQFFEWVMAKLEETDDPRAQSLIKKSPTKGIYLGSDNGEISRGQFETTELKTIFSKDHIREYDYEFQYWMPIIMRVMGTRPEEISQSFITDWAYNEEIGHWYLKIAKDNFGNKKLKTNSAKRIVPLHPKLIELGFEEFLAERKKNAKSPDERLFNELPLTDNYYSTKFCKWFNYSVMGKRNINKRDFADLSRSVYSFRHNFLTMTKKHSTLEQAQAIIGHKEQNLNATKKYWHGYELEELTKVISSMHFEDLIDVPHYSLWRKIRADRLKKSKKKAMLT